MSVSKNSLLKNFSVSTTLALLGPPMFNIRIPVFTFELLSELTLNDRTLLKTWLDICLVYWKFISLKLVNMVDILKAI